MNSPPGLSLGVGNPEGRRGRYQALTLVALFLGRLFLGGPFCFFLCWHRLSPLSIRKRGGCVKNCE